MALKNVSDIINEVLVRNNRTTTDAFITDQMLFDWTREANSYCTTQYKWPLSEIRDKSLVWSGSEEVPYEDFTVNYKADSIRILQIGGKRLKKINFEEFLSFKEDESSSQERIFSDYGRTLWINTVADVSGTITAFGQYSPLLDPTDAAATTIFSTFDEEGNEAIVEKMTSYLKRREHLTDEAELHDQRTDTSLAKLWKKVQDEQYKYHPAPDSEGTFERFSVIHGTFDDSLSRDQFN